MKRVIKDIFRCTPFYPVHLGQYLRKMNFFKCLSDLPIKSFQQVLDAGCGPGDCSLKLAKAHPHLRIIGKDIKKFDSWRKLPPNVEFQQQDLHQMSEKNSYDFCFSIDVLEHIPNNRKVLENIYQGLKLSGYFYLQLPSRNQRRILPKGLFKKTEKKLQKEHIGQLYTLKEIRDVLESIGFDIVKAHHTFGFWGKLAWEVDRITDEKRFIKIILMPLLKVFAQFDYWLPKTGGNGVLVISRK